MAAFAPPEINREVRRDSIEPGREARTLFELAQVLICSYESFLSQLDCIVLIMHYRECYVGDPPLISLHQHPERVGIPFPGALDELGFVAVLAALGSQLD